MSKLDEKIIDNLKMLSLDMIYKASSGDAGIVFSSSPIFYNLFKNHLIFDPNNKEFINKDRLIVSDRLLPLLYSCETIFYKNQNIDDLKDYKGFNSAYKGVFTTNINGDVISTSVGVALGEIYLDNLIKFESPKTNLLDFKTYCILTIDELMSGASYEAMSFARVQELNNLIFIVISDEVGKDSSNKETFLDNLTDRFMSLNFNVDIINDNINTFNDAILDAKESKKPSIIIVKSTYGKKTSRENSNNDFNKPLSKEEMDHLRNTFAINNPFTVDSDILLEIQKDISKRLSKYLINWQSEKQKLIGDLKIKEIIDFLEKKRVNISFNEDNLKINENYEESLLKSNQKILNIIASKSPFILCGSDDNFTSTLSIIQNSNVMNKSDRLGRNILFGNRTLAMGGISCGLASLGFKVFISTPLINESLLNHYIKQSVINDLDVNYIFTNDSFLNSYQNNEYHSSSEFDDLVNIPSINVYRPADIKEIIGTYDTLLKIGKNAVIVLNNSITPIINGTNEKYVIAGAYRVKKEENENIDAIIITSGSEVSMALKVVQELSSYNLNFRVVSMVSPSLFEKQSTKYKSILLPKDIKTFTLEFSNSMHLEKYATNLDYVFKVNNFFVGGSKEEKLKYYDLNIDAIKRRILELIKN